MHSVFKELWVPVRFDVSVCRLMEPVQHSLRQVAEINDIKHRPNDREPFPGPSGCD